MITKILSSTSVLLLLWGQGAAFSQTATWHGQLSGCVTGNPEKSLVSQVGIRYIPDILIEKPLAYNLLADVEISLNGYATGDFHDWENTELEGKLKPYRFWLRFSTDRLEARLGLQKINFGSAILFRPLMWFDRIDPRDPLQFTDGVYALLFRYYFQNNTNIWFWGLYGNDEAKGWEVSPTEKETTEYGGRVQMPLFKGEIGLTYHHRQADFTQSVLVYSPLNDGAPVPENRFGLDGKWDVGVGLWFEEALIHQQIESPGMKYRRLWTVGADYTFGVGNGLNAVCEYFNSERADEAFGAGEGISFSALSMSYPLGLVDNLSGTLYHDWDKKDWYRLITWQRTYDNWIFYLIGFWNPENVPLYQDQSGNNPFAGKGFQFMVVFNH